MDEGMYDPVEGGWIDYEIGETYFKMKQFDKALEYYNLALAAGADDPWIYYKKGIVQLINGKISEGMEELKRAIDETRSALVAGNKNPMLSFNLGLFHLAIGDEPVARNYYADGLRVEPSTPKIKEARRDLENFLEVWPKENCGHSILAMLKERSG